jgi:hypothetical protein
MSFIVRERSSNHTKLEEYLRYIPSEEVASIYSNSANPLLNYPTTRMKLSESPQSLVSNLFSIDYLKCNLIHKGPQMKDSNCLKVLETISIPCLR